MTSGPEPAPTLGSELSGLLSPDAAALYDRVLEAPLPREQTRRNDPAVAELIANGLARIIFATGELYALPPEAALSRSLHAATIRWLADAPDFAGALESINTLAARRARQAIMRDDALVAHNRAAMESLMSEATTSWWTLQPSPEGVADRVVADPSSWDEHSHPPAHLSVRTVYDGRLLRFPAFYEFVREQIARGADVRFADWALPTTLAIADERTALYFPHRASSGVVTERVGHISLLCLAFEGAFSRSVPLQRDSELTDAHQRIHAMLGLGHSTRAIASMVGVNERTVRRRINELMDHYGVSSRNELAAIAAAPNARTT